MDDILNELARYDDGFQPSSLDIEAGIDTLANGEYQLEIVGADLARTPQTKEAIFRLKLKVLAGPSSVGAVVERVNFFGKQESVNILGGDLAALGFPADRWCRAYGKSFATEFGAILPHLKGIRFAGRKTSKKADNTPNGQVYHNLYVRGKISGPIRPPAPAATTPQKPSPATAQPAPKNDSDGIPF